MKEKIKLLGIIFLTFICSAFLGITIINAESVASSLTIKSSNYKNPPMSFPQTFHVKKTTSGKWAYCITYAKKTPYSGVKYKKDDIVDDKGKYYILKEAEKNVKSNKDFFIYQTALWIYMSDKGIMNKSYSVSKFRSKVYSSNSATAKKIKSLVAAAKKAPKIDKSAPTISLSVNNKMMHLSDNQYVSDKIKLTSSTSSYNISLSNAPKGTTYKVSGGYLYVYVPKSSITALNNSFKVTASNSKTIYNGQNYKPSNSKYQKMAVVFKTTKNASSSVTLTINKGIDVKISKQAVTGGKELPGATLILKSVDGTQVDKWVSTDTVHYVKNLQAGTYTLTEQTAPDGYKLSEETIKFTIDQYGKLTDEKGNSIDQVVMKNALNDVKISKQDVTTNKELAGAGLVVKNNEGKVIDSWTSTDGVHVIKGIKVGTYTLSEVVTPKGYVETKETVQFTIDEYGNVFDKNNKKIDKVIMYNTPQKEMNVQISKQDIATSKELPGATLVLKNSNKEVVDTWVSTNEVHVVKYMIAGTYTLTEIVAPSNYKLSEETIKFNLDKDGNLTDKDGKKIDKVIMYNELKKKNSIKISKQDITTKKELAGASLTVIDKDNNVIATWVSTEEDYIIDDIEAGKYTLIEKDAPAGYELSKEKIEFSVDKDGKITDKDGKKIDKVVMYNKKTNKLNVIISKQDVATSKELPGASLVVKDANGNEIDSWVSSDDAHVIKDIKAGTYTLTETQAPSDYILNTESIKFTIAADGKLTDENGQEVNKIIMYNEHKKDKNVTISKQDIATSKELPGASLVVKDASGNVVDSWISTSDVHVIKDIKAGTYTLTETQAPSDYVLSSETIKFTIDDNGKLTNEVGNEIDKVVMFNKRIPKTNVTISKQDITTSKELPGASLVVKDASGNVVDSWISTNDVHVIKNLVAGTYTLTETQAPSDYILSSETITFIIDENCKLLNKDGQSIDKVIMYNEKKIVPFNIPIIKQDAKTHKNVSGATLEIKDATGKVLDTWTTSVDAHYVELTEGTYTLTETSAPLGYILNTSSIVFNVDKEGNLTDNSGKPINSVIMNNVPVETKVSVSKQDITNGKEIPGAKLVVKDANGNVIDTWTSTTTPHLINGLVPGEYTLNEVIAPNGYVLSDETIRFTVKADGSITSVVMYNSPKPVPNKPVNPVIPTIPTKTGNEIVVENTASSKSVISTLVGGLFMGLGTLTIRRKRKNLI